jgi:hypothetical protein
VGHAEWQQRKIFWGKEIQGTNMINTYAEGMCRRRKIEKEDYVGEPKSKAEDAPIKRGRN